jgi:hypothetical protein
VITRANIECWISVGLSYDNVGVAIATGIRALASSGRTGAGGAKGYRPTLKRKYMNVPMKRLVPTQDTVPDRKVASGFRGGITLRRSTSDERMNFFSAQGGREHL